jgi:hypothetical protein
MIFAPRQVNELGVYAYAQNLGIAVLELPVLAAKLGDLGWADKGKVLRPEENNLTTARIVLVRNRFELLVFVEAHGGSQRKRGELFSNTYHAFFSLK